MFEAKIEKEVVIFLNNLNRIIIYNWLLNAIYYFSHFFKDCDNKAMDSS